MADIPDLGHFAFPCGESQFRAQMQNILNWMEDLQTTSIPIGGVLMWAKPLADAPAGFVMADGTANSVANGGTGKDLRGFIKVSADPPGTEVAAVRTGDTTSEGAITARTAGTPAADAITCSNVTLTASGTTGSTSAGTASGNTAYESAHYHQHYHTIASGLEPFTEPTEWVLDASTPDPGHSHGSAVAASGGLGSFGHSVTSVGAAETTFRAAADGTGPSHGIQTNTDQTTSSHRHAFSGVTFGAHTHTFSDANVGLVSSDEHNHTISFTGALMGTHTHPLVMDEHDHTPGAPAATTVILLERIF
jgi:hypothetical protein